MNRREMILRTGAAAVGLSLTGCQSLSSSPQAKTRKVLFFTKSSGFEHSVIKRQPDGSSFAGKILADLGQKHGIEFTESKDGSLFAPEYLAGFDAYMFYTTGDLTSAGQDKNPPMTPEGKAAFLDAIHNGKGFIGTHAATDTFHTNEPGGRETRGSRYRNYGDQADPYIKMIGGEFIIHNAQQESKMRVTDSKFPGMKAAGDGFVMHEEWYSNKEFAKNLHVLLVQETEGMKGNAYQRPPYPATWARMHGKGRVFYTSMGHREDVWTNPMFQEILFGGIAWAVRNADANVTPNLEKVTPGCFTIPPA
jgi:uncharacterized protein